MRILQQTALLEIIDPQGQYLPPGTLVNTSLGSAAERQAAIAGATPVQVASPLAAPPVAGTPIAGTPIAGETPPSGPTYETIVSGSDLKTAYITTGNTGVNQVVGFELQGDAASKFFQYTSSHLGEPMSIVVDKQVISSPRINGAISSRGIIEGVPPDRSTTLSFSSKPERSVFRSKSFRVRLSDQPSARTRLQRSLLAGIVGLSIVALFMILYYRLPGLISVLALLIYTAIVFAIFKLLPVTLTLAGIAGFILSIGMAVDANVLIFSRTKEELRTGRSMTQAIESGFDHAWPSIRDSNITTMITTFILYFFGSYTGTSIITGFALTLFIGVAVSMFTAITVTRTFLRVLVAAGLTDQRWWFGSYADPTAPTGLPRRYRKGDRTGQMAHLASNANSGTRSRCSSSSLALSR